MRTRNHSKRHKQSTGEEAAMKSLQDAERHSSIKETNDDNDTIRKHLKQVNPHGSRGYDREDSCLCPCDSMSKLEDASKGNGRQVIGGRCEQNTLEAEGYDRYGIQCTSSDVKVEAKSFQHANPDVDDEMDDSCWEDGLILTSTSNHQEDITKGVTIEFDASLESAKSKPVCRASAEDKEVAELAHKVHLLCLLGRGRLIDNACNDPLIQAALLSLLPSHFLEIVDAPRLTVNALAPLVSWFHNNFRIISPSTTDKPFHLALVSALESQEGTSEEVAALSVALFRALNFAARFVAILDVASLKPGAKKPEFINSNVAKTDKGILNSFTLMVTRPNQVSASPVKQSASDNGDNISETSVRGECKTKVSMSKKKNSQLKDASVTRQLNDKMADSLADEVQNDLSEECLTKKSKRPKSKGDLEFEMQLEMALSATAVGSNKSNSDVENLHNDSSKPSPFKRVKKLRSEETSTCSHGISTAVGSRKVGAPLYWAELYCSHENLTGKWVHVDAVNAIVDGEQKVEAAVAACKKTLRYVVAFAGHGAKDVTRRYCTRWYKIASQRINSKWWDAVLAPLKELESGRTGSVVHLKQEASMEHENVEALKISDLPTQEFLLDPVATRTSLEDMELETRALTEPLPTNQQAYKNHQLYAIERWLTKYQIIYPKCHVLGVCAGHPVYPRTCVQILHTKKQWIREGLQIKADELPAKVLKFPPKLKAQNIEMDEYKGDLGRFVALYGKWQTEPLCLRPAVNGTVPKNERGQVDVWSEKCLPPGTVHLKLPRVAFVAKRLEIDFAPAMVGFEFRSGRSFPVFDGIVVCAEFKDAILEAYGEEEERREAEENRRNELHALSRWYQLLSSVVTRQRLNNYYGDSASSQVSIDIKKADHNCSALDGANEDERQSPGCQQRSVHNNNKMVPLPFVPTEDHEHVFLTDDRAGDENCDRQTKRCHCGFSIEVEEL